MRASSPRETVRWGLHYNVAKRRRAAALQDLSDILVTPVYARAFWSAPALWRFFCALATAHFHLPSTILHPLCFRRAFSEDNHHRRRPARRFNRAGRQTPETRAPDRGFRSPSRQPERL